MKRLLFPAMIAAAVIALGACATSPGGGAAAVATPDPAHNARNALDWAGVYHGVLPCADCPGIETVIVLAEDGTYRHLTKYLDREGGVFTEQGQFVWNEAGSTITLTDSDGARYFVGENRLASLARDGLRITGDLAENYVLTKLAEGVTGRYWKLVELNGQPVPTLKREPHLVFEPEDGRVHGFGGCNAFTGSYRIEEAVSRIRFAQLASTLMSCLPAEMEVEKAFQEVLFTADNYALDGERLALHRARMAPLARFEVVYLR